MDNNTKKWAFLSLLALVWGSSFILMKKALIGVTPIQLGALRMLFSSIFLFVVASKYLRKIERKHYKYIVLTAFAGTFFPVFLFAYATSFIDSSAVSILNSFTPLNTLVIGAIMFGFAFKRIQLVGVLFGLIGAVVLILKGAALNPNQKYEFGFLVLIASIGYAINVNVVKKYLGDLNGIAITTGNFVVLVVPALMVLISTGFFTDFDFQNQKMLNSLGYISILSVFGTAIAKTIYNELVHISSPVFSSSVTYLIPIVAVTWGVLDGETIHYTQFFAAILILVGVYLVNKTK